MNIEPPLRVKAQLARFLTFSACNFDISGFTGFIFVLLKLLYMNIISMVMVIGGAQ
jgi:hypothetical protein